MKSENYIKNNVKNGNIPPLFNSITVNDLDLSSATEIRTVVYVSSLAHNTTKYTANHFYKPICKILP